MTATLTINTAQLSPETLRVLLAAANTWQCDPGTAAARLIDELDAVTEPKQDGNQPTTPQP
jgi:hypothetical protein